MDDITDLKTARNALGLSQSQLAVRWGLDLATIWRWEKRGVPRRGAAEKLIEGLIAEAKSFKTRAAA